MSESVSAGASAGGGATSASSAGVGGAPTTFGGGGGSSAGTSSGSVNTGKPSGATAQPSGGSVNPNASGKALESTGAEPSTAALDNAADDFEEVALGSQKAKVPKSLAKQIKDYERGIQKKFEETAKMRKQFEADRQLLEMFRTNPDEFAQRMQVDLDAFAEERLAKKYELMQMSPEQKALLEARQQLEQYQQRDIQTKQPIISEIQELMGKDAPQNLEQYPREELEKFRDYQRHQFSQAQQGLDREFGEAWKESGLPKHRYFGQLMAHTMLSHEKRTGEPLQAHEAAARVKADFVRNVQEICSNMDPQGIQELLGKEILEKIRQYDIERVTANNAASQMNQGPGLQPASQAPKKYLNEIEWRRAMGLT